MKVNMQGSGGTLELADATFGAAFNESLVHQVVTAHLAAARAGTSVTFAIAGRKFRAS